MEFSQEEMAKKLGISRPTYLQIENGERELTITEAATLAEIFGISFYDFLEKKFVKEPRIIVDEEEKSPAADLEIRVTKKDLEKFKQVLLYVLEKVGGKPNVGETVLNKLLYFIDFDYYEKYEENLMGATYIKNHFGPTPVELKVIIDEMKKSQEVMEVKNRVF